MTPLQTYLSDTDKLFEDKWNNPIHLRDSIEFEKEIKSFLHERQVGLVEVMKSEIDLPLLKRILGYLSMSNLNVQPVHLSESARLRQFADETELREADILKFSQILKNLEK